MSPGELVPQPVVPQPDRADPSTASFPDGRAPDLRAEVLALAHTLPGDLRRLTVRNGDRAIEVEWAPDAGLGAGDAVRVDRLAEAAGAGRTPEAAAPAPAMANGAPVIPAGSRAVRAPLVGTFYVAPSPGAEPFVCIGGQVEAGQTLGLVEAMKLMNPIVAEEPGVVSEVLVGDAESVEYDQPLIILRPASGLS